MGNVGFVFAMIVIFAVYGGANWYLGRRIFRWLRLLFPRVGAGWFAAIYALCALSPVLAAAPLPDFPRYALDAAGSYWMGVFVYLLLFFLAADLAMLAGTLLKTIPTPVPRRARFYGGLAALLLAAGFTGYGIVNALQIRQVSYEIRLDEPGSPAAGLRIVLISDLHLGAVGSEKRLASVVDAVNRLEPDLVCIAGDIFNDDYFAIRDPEQAVRLLRSIRSVYGVYASLGNHDGGATFDLMLDFLERSNIRVLMDEYEIVGGRIVLLGRLDPSPIGGYGGLRRKELLELAAAPDKDLPVVVMDHTPIRLEQYDRGFDLILSGHTHKGQIFPANLITRMLFETEYGYYRRDASAPHVVVTSGAGTWGMPMRVGSHNEVVGIRLR